MNQSHKKSFDVLTHVGGIPISGLTRFPSGSSEGHPLIIAIHGGTYTSAYFDIAGYSLLDRGQANGIPIIAIDRLGYGASSAFATPQTTIQHNAELLNLAIDAIWRTHHNGACGVVLIGHSIGGAVATAIAALQPKWPLLGLAISGVGLEPVPESKDNWATLPDLALIEVPSEVMDSFCFGPASTYDQLAMPMASHAANAPSPRSELIDIVSGWPKQAEALASRVNVPVHYRQPEFEKLWVVNDEQIQRFSAAFTKAPSVDANWCKGAGHCIDFHHGGEAFQLEQLAFALRCTRKDDLSART